MIIRAALERGEPIPKGLLDRPDVWPINRVAWDAFWMLSGSRPLIPVGMGGIRLGRIEYSEISTWAADHLVDNLDEFVWLVQQMDTEWLKLNQPKK